MPISKTSQNKFSKLTLQDLVDTFLLKRSLSMQKHFGKSLVSEIQKQQVPTLTNKFRDRIDYLNESELTVKYISKILDMVELESDLYSTFSERNMSAIIQGYSLGGTVDMVVASGFYEPKLPYFFIQEFKKAKNQSGDPLAQLLGEMLVAQKLNDQNIIFGLYIIGRFWTFVVLNNLNFTELEPLNSTDNQDLIEILSHLNWIKQYIENKLKN